MKRRILWNLLILIFLAVLARAVYGERFWRGASPETVGMSTPLLDALRDSLALKGSTSWLVVRHDRMAYEWYAEGYNSTTLNDIGLMARTVAGGLSLAVALSDGRLSLNDPVSEYVPQWQDLPSKSQITFGELAACSAGLEDASQAGTAPDQLPGWKAAFWKQADPPNDPFTLARDSAPVILAPGTAQEPCSTELAMLAYAVTASLRGTNPAQIQGLLRDRIMRPIGIVDWEWSVGHGRTFQVDGLQLVPTWGESFFTSRALARIGRFMLHEGQWQGRQLISSKAIQSLKRDVAGWWTNEDGNWETAPRDAFATTGEGDQILLVIPSLDLVAVRTGPVLDPSSNSDSKQTLKIHLIAPLMESVLDRVEAAPQNAIVRNASSLGVQSRAALTPQSLTVSPQLVSASTALWMRANSGILAGRMAESNTYASGSLTGELVYPNLNSYNTSNTTQADAVSYPFSIPSSGTWYLWARLYYPGTTAQPTNDPNSFWAALDNGSAKVLGNLTTEDKRWHWEGAASVPLSLGTVAAGNHTLKIWNREARETATAKLSPRIDELLITNNATYVPNDADATASSSQVSTIAPYPPSPVIKSITWAPASTIVRKATGSDCWPITGGNDGNLYTAYGDGNGFDPKTPVKLSLGFAKVSGAATSFVGSNIRSATGEQTGNGKLGKKPSGMLMVSATLYMWARNANLNGAQCQLAWSSDHAATWTWSSWKFAEFGYLTFLNFGNNYTGARDGYVYAFSHDNPSAYTAANRMVLLRVPQTQIKNRASYQFFKGRDSSGNPVWTSDITQRGAVFTHPQNCLRSGITYDSALHRYLWWQQIPNSPTDPDTRFKGGFGIYDAPNPWGPWTTAYFAQTWDVGPGETASFPTKWISADGKTLYLVFSGNDSFSVRKATVTLR
jgi:hypothetical protein